MKTHKRAKSSVSTSRRKGSSSIWAVIVGGIILIVGAIAVYIFISAMDEDGYQNNVTTTSSGSAQTSSDYTSPVNTSSANQNTTQPNTSTSASAPEDTEGKPLAVVKGVVRAKVENNLYLIGSEGTEVLFLAHFPASTLQGEIANLAAGDLIALSGEIQELPSARAMETRWSLTPEEAETLHAQVSWYVEVTKVVPRENITTSN